MTNKHSALLNLPQLYILFTLIFRLMVHGLMFPAVLSMNRVKKHKFLDFAREFPDTAQMTGQAVSVNLIAWLVPTSDHFVPLMVPGNLIQPVMVIFATPGTVVTGAQENLVGLVTGLLKQLEVSLCFYPPIQKARFNMRHPVWHAYLKDTIWRVWQLIMDRSVH